MRPVLVILIWVGILGGLWSYMAVRDSVAYRDKPVVQIQPAPGEYTIRLTPTFDVVGGADSFSTKVDDQHKLVEQSPIVVWLNGQEIARRNDVAFAGKPIEIRWNAGDVPVKVEMQKNEFRISAFSPHDDPQAVHGMRFELLRDDRVINDQTLWAPPGNPLNDVVPVVIDEYLLEEADHSDHS